jgi:hypothetical protein
MAPGAPRNQSAAPHAIILKKTFTGLLVCLIANNHQLCLELLPSGGKYQDYFFIVYGPGDFA